MRLFMHGNTKSQFASQNYKQVNFHFTVLWVPSVPRAKGSWRRVFFGTESSWDECYMGREYHIPKQLQ